MFCPSAVEGGIFIKTAMTCFQTSGMMVGAEGVIRWGWCQGAWQGGLQKYIQVEQVNDLKLLVNALEG